MSSRIMGILATLAATLLIVFTLIGVAGPIFHFGFLSAENLGERMGWVSAGWQLRNDAAIWWTDGIFDGALALVAGIAVFPYLLAADKELERRRAQRELPHGDMPGAGSRVDGGPHDRTSRG